VNAKSWFGEGFKLAFVAILSAELATQIDLTHWFDLPIFDWNFSIVLERIVGYGIAMALVVSFIVGGLAAGFAYVIRSSHSS
jgi:hypothetical protein